MAHRTTPTNRHGARQQQQPFAGVDRGGHASLALYGVSATIHRVIQEVEDGSELVSWPDEAGGELVERHDARLLLDPSALSLTAHPAKRPRSSPGPEGAAQSAEQELDAERYRDLLNTEQASPPGSGPASPSFSEPHSSAKSYTAVLFSYGNAEEADAQGDATAREVGVPEAPPAAAVAGPGEPRYVPRFSLPERLRQGPLPATQRHFAIIQRTADFVRQVGGQAEVLLRVKQAGNPLFSFLLLGDPLHPLYRWLVEADPSALAEIDTAPGAATEGEEPETGERHQQQQQSAEAAAEQTADVTQVADGGDDGVDQGLDSLALLGQYGEEEEEREEGAAAAPDLERAEPTPEHTEAPAAETEAPATAGAFAKDLQSLAVMRALIGRVQRMGPPFEALVRQREGNNPDFEFIHAGGRHHTAYAAALVEALGQEQAELILAISATAVSAAAKSRPAAAAAHGKGGAELCVDDGDGAGKGGPAGSAQLPPWIKDRIRLDGASGDVATAGDETAGPEASAAPSSEADDAKKAERRRRARELLRQRLEQGKQQQAAAVQRAAEERRRQLSAIAMHKRMFTGGNDDDA